MRPWLSVTGTRCTRCGPPSYLKRGQTPSPCTTNVTSLKPPRSLTRRPTASRRFQPVAAGVGQVHLEQVAGEEVGLLAALGAADLDDHVAPVVRVGRHQQLGAARRRRPPSAAVGVGQLGLEQRPLVAGRPRRAARGRRRRRPRAAAPAARRVDDGVELRGSGWSTRAQLGRVGGDAPGRRGAPRGRRAPAPWRRGGQGRRRRSDMAAVEATGASARSCRFLSCIDSSFLYRSCASTQSHTSAFQEETRCSSAPVPDRSSGRSTAAFDRAFDQLTSSLFAPPARRTPVVDAAWDDGVLRADRRPARHARATPSRVASPAARSRIDVDDRASCTWSAALRLGAAARPRAGDGHATSTAA